MTGNTIIHNDTPEDHTPKNPEVPAMDPLQALLAETNASVRELIRQFYAAGGRPSWTQFMAWGEDERAWAVEADGDRSKEDAQMVAFFTGVALGGDPVALAVVIGDEELRKDMITRAEVEQSMSGQGSEPMINARMARPGV